MIEKIAGITIHGRCFKQPVSLKVFQNTDERISILYGKNGSGKSTISEGFFSLSHNLESSDLQSVLIDKEGNSLPAEDIKEDIFVFNENYIDKNVKINDDGLGTIILLGGQVDLQSEIDKYEYLHDEANKRLIVSQTTYEKYCDINNPLSPSYHWERIKSILKEPGGWADIDSQIKSLRRNSSVSDDLAKEICLLSTTNTLSELQQEFSHTKLLLERASDPNSNYPTAISQITIPVGLENQISELLSKHIEKPVLTEREMLILSVIQAGKQKEIEDARETFSNSQTEICPYCFQSINNNYKERLIESINRVLNKDVEQHKKELEEIQITKIPFIYEQFLSLDSELVSKVNNELTKFNEIIDQYNMLVVKKKNNMYTPVNNEILGLEKVVKQLNDLLDSLEKKRQELNDAAKQSKTIRTKLIDLNKQIANKKVGSLFKDYLKQQKEAEIAKAAFSAEREKMSQIVEHLKLLKQKKANIGLAIQNINNALDYVFFSHGRLSIELRDNKYYLKSNGNDVRPKNVSLGERNIIALCYFFTQMMANQEITKLYTREQLLIIDDPVSSFDFENKVGILSYLRYQIKKIIFGNNNSKVLIMSHDLTTIFDLQKATGEICQATKSDAKVANTNCSWLELADGLLMRFSKTRSEYAELINLVYTYAENPSSQSGLGIGNTMRRVLEAFSTFNYRKSVQDVLCDTKILDVLGARSIYFENLMCRLVLHNESHFEEQVYNLHDDANFYNFVSDFEKQRTAKDVLCFIYLLNTQHIIAYLGNIKHAINTIKDWCREIPNNTSFEIVESILNETSREKARLII